MNDTIGLAPSHIHEAFARANDRLEQELTSRDLRLKSGPQHRHRKLGWDFNTLGATYCIRHARRYRNIGQPGAALALRATAVPLGLVALTLVGFIPKVAVATTKWTWYMGYQNPQGADSLRKDFVQAELQEASADLQALASYASENPSQRQRLLPVWQQARQDIDEFREHLSSFGPKIGGSHRIHKVLNNYTRILDAQERAR